MWTSTLELKPSRVLLTQLLGPIWHGAYFSSFAPLQVRNLPRQPLPAANWVRVRNILAGICGSDLHLIFVNGDFRIAPAALPGHKVSYPGHEVVGEVIEVGDDVQRLHVGDRVVLQHGPNCLSAEIRNPCRSCADGNYSLCEDGRLPGPYPVGGGWSEEMLLHEQQLYRVPSAISDEQAVLLEPTAVALHAVLRHLPQPGDHVLIVGAGTIGLLVLQAVRALVPDAEISVQARHAFQVEQATRMGAAHIIYPQDSYREVQRATGARLYNGMMGNKMILGGYDVIYDTIGNRKTTHDSLRWTRAGGTVVMIGLDLHAMKIDLTPIWYQEINLIGSMGQGAEQWPSGTGQKQSTFDIVAELIEEGKLHPQDLLTHRFALTDSRNAFRTAASKSQSRAMKVVFDYSLLPASVVPNVRAAARQRPPRKLFTASQATAEQEKEDTLEPAPASPVVPPVQPVQLQPPTPVAPALSAMLPPPIMEEENEDDARTIVVPRRSLHPEDETEHYLPTPDEIQAMDEDNATTIVVARHGSTNIEMTEDTEDTEDTKNIQGTSFYEGEDEARAVWQGPAYPSTPTQDETAQISDIPMPDFSIRSISDYRGTIYIENDEPDLFSDDGYQETLQQAGAIRAAFESSRQEQNAQTPVEPRIDDVGGVETVEDMGDVGDVKDVNELEYVRETEWDNGTDGTDGTDITDLADEIQYHEDVQLLDDEDVGNVQESRDIQWPDEVQYADDTRDIQPLETAKGQKEQEEFGELEATEHPHDVWQEPHTTNNTSEEIADEPDAHNPHTLLYPYDGSGTDTLAWVSSLHIVDGEKGQEGQEKEKSEISAEPEPSSEENTQQEPGNDSNVTNDDHHALLEVEEPAPVDSTEPVDMANADTVTVTENRSRRRNAKRRNTK